jgi:predicted RNA-binding protein with PUA-like domain
MNDMVPGDLFLFYHSNAQPRGVAGVGTIHVTARPDPSALNPKSEYYEPKSSQIKPIWYCVTVQFKKLFPKFVSLESIKATKELQQMVLVKPGTRLSIQPVTKKEFALICKMGGL